MGSYESLKVGSSVELTVDEAAVNLPDVYNQLDQLLSDALAADIKEAIELLPAGSTSYVLSWRQNA